MFSIPSELFALVNGPSWTPVSVNSCVVDGGSLNDLDNATLHIDGQSTVVDAPPDIIDVPDEDDDIIGDEDALPHDLLDFDVEDLINIDMMVLRQFILVKKKIECRQHMLHFPRGDVWDDRPPSHVVPTGCGGCFANKVPVLTSWSHKDSSFWTEIYETTTCTCKKPTIPTRLFQGQVLEADLTTVKLDDVSRSCGTPRGDNSAEWDKDPGRWLAFEDEEGLRPLKSTLHSLTPSGEHTLFTGGDEKLEATVSPRR
ncbi:hypothetical protein Tco_0705185 [Tanacetum coccineum]|uniref:Uncharacterized protein n=1 Tax=Tanacetum coccineum TaxID=301880 RepID=A0ABQ4Y3Z0_9ASTR